MDILLNKTIDLIANVRQDFDPFVKAVYATLSLSCFVWFSFAIISTFVLIKESKLGIAIILIIFFVIHAMDYIAFKLFDDKIKMEFTYKSDKFL